MATPTTKQRQLFSIMDILLRLRVSAYSRM